MSRRPSHWGKIVFLYIFQLFSYATSTVHVQLIAPHYVTYGSTATLHCNHSVPDIFLHKVEFMKDDKKILQYIKDRNPPFLEWRVDGANMENIFVHLNVSKTETFEREDAILSGRKTLPLNMYHAYLENGTTIKLKDVRFEASGSYSCQVSMTTPIYTEASDFVQMKVIVPQTDNPKITFKKSMYVVGETLEANCTSSAAYPVPHLTWFINGKEVDITLVNHYPHTRHKDQLMSATAKLMIEVSALHAGENGYLEISCYSTIPDFPIRREQYADVRKETVSVQIIPAPIAETSAQTVAQGWTLATMLCILCAMHKIIP